ncbi:DEAD/DEAH box helicase [Staphylococcus ratti]|uniref:AAA domain-containing protein n=1 Tax=Staphylococcus ratti TaxID=2892440 RepID=A0ABY3PD57_9STAP|nr:DEAD/DEAH box helicase [Staphylococcus ratti]UEX90169.1 AAA domain-containing protein [Staphylococcus ratti]
MGDLVKNTLSAWGLIETLQPGELSDLKGILSAHLFENNESQEKGREFENFYPIWENRAFVLKKESRNKGAIKFQMYRFCFNFGEIEKRLRAAYNDEEVYNPSTKKCYGYTFTVDDKGFVEIDSLFVPMLMTAMRYFKHDKNIEKVHEDNFEKFKFECEEVLGGNPLDASKIQKMDELYCKYFEKFKTEFLNGFQHTVKVKFVRPNDVDQELNSFYLTDIESARENPNETLKQYITGTKENQKTNIDENRKLIEYYLQPKFYPDGRWPSLVEHRLSLMQQVAVNHITHDNKLISSVNGPPGTGKTTLLKDLFAHHIVERAKTFAELSHPKEAFKAQKIHETDQHPTHFLKEVHAQFKMVVASSNNGAVENISKDLPKISEVIRNEVKTKYPQYETEYQLLAKELEIFKGIASHLINEEAWGIFSGVLGKKRNIDKVMDQMLGDDKALNHILIREEAQSDVLKNWKEAKKSFNDTLKRIQKIKLEIKNGYEKYQDYSHSIAKMEQFKNQVQKLKQTLEHMENSNKLECDIASMSKEIQFINKQIEDIDEYERTIQPSSSLKEKLKKWVVGSNDNEDTSKYSAQKAALIERKIDLNHQKHELQKDVDHRKKEEANILKEMKGLEANIEKLNARIVDYEDAKTTHNGLMYPDEKFWKDSNEAYCFRQESVLFTSDELQFQRGLLFLKAMVLHKYILIGNAKSIQSGLYDFKRRYEYLKSAPIKVKNAWNIIHLIFPVISTTFASFSTLYTNMSKDFIDYLYIDEAGQAVPQAAVGALHRSRHVVAVGDPLQIEPVVTLERHLIDLVRNAYNVPERLVSIDASVQTIADYANNYGYWKGQGDEKQWIGMPLWVHRRCLNPMFTISNSVAYENKMVLPQYVKNSEIKGKTGEVTWLNVTGNAKQKQFVEEQGKAVLELLKGDWLHAQKNGDIAPNVFVISPFTAIKTEISRLARKQLKSFETSEVDINDWVKASIGTVHTFQGKEADKVYFVTGTDHKQNGAIQWSCSKPNLINVAVTRAKKEFVIIGDEKRISKLKYYNIIKRNLSKCESQC